MSIIIVEDGLALTFCSESPAEVSPFAVKALSADPRNINGISKHAVILVFLAPSIFLEIRRERSINPLRPFVMASNWQASLARISPLGPPRRFIAADVSGVTVDELPSFNRRHS